MHILTPLVWCGRDPNPRPPDHSATQQVKPRVRLNTTCELTTTLLPLVTTIITVREIITDAGPEYTSTVTLAGKLVSRATYVNIDLWI